MQGRQNEEEDGTNKRGKYFYKKVDIKRKMERIKGESISREGINEEEAGTNRRGKYAGKLE